MVAVAEGEPCVTYIGADGAGHYVKNGSQRYRIWRYATDCRRYSVLKHSLGLTNEELAETFTEWNKGELSKLPD